MPKPTEIGVLKVNGKVYKGWETISVVRSGVEVFPRFSFTAASPVESASNFAGMKLKIGDKCDVILAGRPAISNGQITGRQAAYTAQQHGLQITGTTYSHAVVRADVDHERGEFKGYSLSQIANSVLAPYKTKFSLKGDTEGMDQPFPKINVQAGETVYDFLERLCKFRNVFLQTDMKGDLVGYRMKSATGVIAELEEGRNILSANGTFNYTGGNSEINVIGQRPGNDQYFGDAARDVTGKATNSALKQFVPRRIVAEMPGDASEMRARAAHENAFQIADQVAVQVVVQGWLKDNKTLWLEHIGEPVSVYSPMLFSDDRLNLAIQEVASVQGPQGTLTTLSLCLPEAFNGKDQINSGGVPAGVYGTSV